MDLPKKTHFICVSKQYATLLDIIFLDNFRQLCLKEEFLRGKRGKKKPSSLIPWNS